MAQLTTREQLEAAAADLIVACDDYEAGRITDDQFTAKSNAFNKLDARFRAMINNYTPQNFPPEIFNGSLGGAATYTLLNTAGIQTVGSAGTDIDAIMAAVLAIRTSVFL